ncbi:FAD-dependent oxidoreductase [Archangium violaceum]|uniref:FAD-dependent oxidoreductase n=1 Tax=Archangium violaceum TaxID=83451 RepID=UPI00194ED288|nr:FAD-dependent oxidoreductase [Archangium violaceum]QRO01911.1 FAD-dependent oxidoreductase [Archangium violaceum]
MNQHVDVAVLIVGAGPTGLTLACDLARRGVACRIVEKAPEYFTGSRGKGLQPRSLEVLDDLGVIDAVLAAGAPYPSLRTYAGRTVVWEGRMDEPREPTPDVPYANIWMLPQWRTEELLRARLTALGGHVELATELIGFEQDEEGVTATLLRPGGTERIRTSYLVGADGGRSFVRKHLGVGFEGETYETDRMLIGDFQVEGLDRDSWHTWADPEKRTLKVGLCPLPGTNVFQFTAPFSSDDVPELSLESFQKIFNEGSGRTDVRLHDPSWMSLYRTNIRMVDRYRVGRVFLAGDAAHVHSPAGGQGLNTGIQDAYNLGWKLGQVLAGASPALLDSYEEERLPVAADVLGISTRLHKRSAQGDPDAHRRGPETQQLGLNYRGGPLARDERDAPGRVRAGDRAPDAPCHDAAGHPVRLFDTFRGPHFTLLAFGAAHADTVSRITARYGPSVHVHTVVEPGAPTGSRSLVDTHGHARKGYDLDGDALVLVRPDGYIGLVTRAPSADSVDDYLGGFGSAGETAPVLPAAADPIRSLGGALERVSCATRR